MDDMIYVTVYIDTITDYTQDMIDDIVGNGGTFADMVDVQFPMHIVEGYYNEYGSDFKGDTFDDWLKHEYTCDDTDGLYEYSIDHGYHPKPPMPEMYEVEFTATYQVYAFSADEAVTIASNMRNNDDYYIYVDGTMYS